VSDVTFGVEEEFVLLDPRTLMTVDLGLAAVAELGGSSPGVIVREFFPSQIEFATPVCTTVDEALTAVGGFRRRLSDWADRAGVVVAPSGTPFATDGREPALEGRYALIAHDIAGLTAEHQLNGLHVHVGIPDRDAGIRASNFLRPWLPVLLALSGNSPFWQSHDTGFASWRAIHSRRWTTHGIPPHFADAAEHDAIIARLVGVGATSDPATINWHVRLSPVYPTLEVRTCDVQLDPFSSVALAAIVRALVVEGFERETPRPERYEGWDAALWHAARHGTAATLVDPTSGAVVSAAAAVERLQDLVHPRLPDADRELVERFLSDAAQSGGGATRQRRAHRAGRLAALYRDQVAPAGRPEPVG
jgi:carboxylate-amine ligase